MHEINFQLRVTEEDIDRNLQARIAALNPTLLGRINADQVAMVLDSTSGIHAIAAALQDQEIVTGRVLTERAQTFRQLGEAFLHRDANRVSYGIHMPSYLEALHRYKDVAQPHDALLVGALTPETVVEHAIATRHIFPDVALHAIDVNAAAGMHAAYEATNTAYTKGNALRMPYPRGSMDIIQAHYLVDQLIGERSARMTQDEGRLKFLQEAHATLAKDGLLLLVEPSIPRPMEDAIPCEGGAGHYYAGTST